SPMLIFVTGPVRSGKSQCAQRLAHTFGKPVTYIATARHDENDAEWVRRIERHRRDRPLAWRTIETADQPIEKLEEILHDASSDDVLLIDSVGTWLADAFAEFPSAQDVGTFEEALDR